MGDGEVFGARGMFNSMLLWKSQYMESFQATCCMGIWIVNGWVSKNDAVGCLLLRVTDIDVAAGTSIEVQADGEIREGMLSG